MRQTFKTLLLMLFVSLFSTAMLAQSNSSANRQRRITREQLAERQASYIADQLAFDDKTTTRFTTTFRNYQRDVWALGPRPQTAKERLDRSQKILNLRERYYDEYAKFLSDQQINRVYQLERQLLKRMAKIYRGGKR